MSQAGPATTGTVKADELRAVAASLGGKPPGDGNEGGVGRVGADPLNSSGLVRFAKDDRSAGGGARVRLGEELPIFCEKCGYALHGLPQDRCDRCAILHFSCPECGHRQPINTLRPAAQRILGRVRAFVLGLWVFFKLNFFGWLLFAWFAMGVEWGYRVHASRSAGNPNNWTYQMMPRPVDLEAMMAFSLFALAFGMVGRMLLLRWRRGVAVGAVMGGLVLLASYTGAWFRAYVDAPRGTSVALPVGDDFQMLLIATAATVTLAAVIVWPIWMALAHLFLPARTAAALLDWQRSVGSAAPALARQE